jgi:broad specificity phosphatase PhoE
VEPLASELGIDIETDERLGEGGAGLDEELVASLITTSGRRDAAVCVTHGDLIANFIMDLEASGVPLSRHEPRWEKGSTWVLSAGEQSHIAKATYIAPPIIAPPIT